MRTINEEDHLLAGFYAALWHIPGEVRLEQLRMTKKEMWGKLQKLAMLERAFPDLVMALEGVLDERVQLGQAPTTRSIYANVIMGRLRSGEYEGAPPLVTAEKPRRSA